MMAYHNNISLRLERFLEDLEKQIDLYKNILPSKEEYTINEAKNIIPEDMWIDISKKGFVLVKCVEYLVHCDSVDKAQYYFPPQGWIPPELREEPHSSQRIKGYSRTDNQGNKWWGVIILQKEK